MVVRRFWLVESDCADLSNFNRYTLLTSPLGHKGQDLERICSSSGLVIELCVPKFRFCNIDGEGRRIEL
jgi:hypothetical protein